MPLTHDSIFALFETSARRHAERPFVHVLPETARAYGITAGEITYARMSSAVKTRRGELERAGYGPCHRIGLLAMNRPDFLVNWLAMNALGICLVPINPDLRVSDLAYLVTHSGMVLAISVPDRTGDLATAGDGLPVTGLEGAPPRAPTPPGKPHRPGQLDEAALLYTSGTTGLPKGCVLSNRYFLNCAQWYGALGGYCALTRDGERMLTPLPLFHMNALACSVMAMIAVGGCLTVLDRFHPSTWWDSVRRTRASVVHYLGVMPPLLMKAPPTADDRLHQVRFGFGAGVERRLHGPFEDRFGFPLIEAWAMTETGNGAVIAATSEPRHVGTGCFGRPGPELQVRIETRQGAEAAPGKPGELLVRRTGPDPRYGFFDRYLKDEAATAKAWRGGWFHTGDVVRANADGTLVFVDRKKNVIRRSGENIAASEVETVLSQHPGVRAAAVTAVADDIRQQEVFALIVPAHAGTGDTGLAERITRWCLDQLAYFKAPGHIAFASDLPLTATNKIARTALNSLAGDLVGSPGSFDMRHLKKKPAP